MNLCKDLVLLPYIKAIFIERKKSKFLSFQYINKLFFAEKKRKKIIAVLCMI